MRDGIGMRRYFIINRGSQYGKTTTLTALAESLKEDYTVISLDFQKMGTEGFQNEFTFASAFVKMVMDVLKSNTRDDVEGMMQLLACFIADEENVALRELFLTMSQLCGMAG